MTTQSELLNDRIVDFISDRREALTKSEAIGVIEEACDQALLWATTNLSDPREPRHAPSMIGSVDRPSLTAAERNR